MSKLKTNWRLYERGHVYPQSISSYFDLVRISPSKKNLYIANHNEILTFVNGYLWWARDSEAIEKTAGKWVKGWLNSKSKLDNLLKLFEDLDYKTKHDLPILRRVPIKSVTDRALFNLYEDVKNIFLSNAVFAEYSVDLFDDFFNKIFTQELEKLTKGKITQSDIIKLLQSAQITESLKYRKKLLEFSFLKNITQKDLNKIINEFSWIAMGWDGSNGLTISHLKKDLSKLKKVNIGNRKKEWQKIKNFKQQINSERKKILKKYKLSSARLKPYFYLLDIFVVFHDRRKENQMRCNQIIFPALQEISKRFKINYVDLLFYFNPEIKNLCLNKKKLNLAEIKQKRKGVTWIIKEGKVEEFLGPEAKKVLDKLVLSTFKTDKSGKVLGEPASAGKIKGRVFVTKNSKEANKNFKKGDILITTMTTVDFLPVMHRAGAIVTDDGGATCHAAIISREMEKPCVVGTKVATRIFKTGDMVEVDAEKGIVRRLK